MRRTTRLKLALFSLLGLLLLLIGYRIFLLVHESDYRELNPRHISDIESRLDGRREYRFGVIGNMRNAMRIFEQRLVPLIREQKLDFLVSTGNAVLDGAEDKYRLLYRGLKKSGIPYVLGVGENEFEDFGASRFYRHFGPYFFSFRLSNAVFLFLDSTGTTSWPWQIKWLRQELARNSGLAHRFVFLDHSPLALPGFQGPKDNIRLLSPSRRRQLQEIFRRYKVTAVFSCGYPVYDLTVRDGVRYVTSGGGGGLHLAPSNPYQLARVRVRGDEVLIDNLTGPSSTGAWREKLETLKLVIHSLFYVNLFNGLFILTLIGLSALKIYSLLIRQEELYRDFSVDEDILNGRQLRVCMFTNNYLPFLGGVPLSIDRLYRGLIRRGWSVRIFAPTYQLPGHDPEDGSVIRCPGLFSLHLGDFPLVNTLSPRIGRHFKRTGCDLVHVHHPFGLGAKGLRLARRQGVPVVFTYHTRLEKYTHYIPLPSTPLKNLFAHLLIKRFANRCDAIITPTGSTEEYLRNLGVRGLIETIPTGISMDEYLIWSDQEIDELRRRYTPNGEKLLITVSRLAREKNLDFLIDGLAKAAGMSLVPFVCLIVGEGPERKRLERRVRTLGQAKRILFPGSLPPHQVARHYLAADLFVFASTSETQGMVLAEAMAGGCPVVAVRSSGVHDVLRNGINGIAVAESTSNWARAVVELLTDDRQREQMAARCRRMAREFSEEKTAEKVDRLYRRVLIISRAAAR